jgi:hypothetical protein
MQAMNLAPQKSILFAKRIDTAAGAIYNYNGYLPEPLGRAK